MFKKYDQKKETSDNKIICRYLSLAKFIDLIESEELYFSNLIELSDQYEGNYIELEDFFLFPGKKAILNELKNFYVNCWNINDYESNLLWKVYGGHEFPSIAIQSTIGKLKNSIKSNSLNSNEFKIEEVKYGSIKNLQCKGPFDFASRKPDEYLLENEIRLIWHKKPNCTKPVRLKIDLNIMIERIVVYEQSDWQLNLVYSLIKAYKRDKLLNKVNRTTIREKLNKQENLCNKLNDK